MLRYVNSGRECERVCGEVAQFRAGHAHVSPSRDRWRLQESRTPPAKASSKGDYIGTLHGHFAIFNSWTEINSFSEGRFMERVLPGAFTKTFEENRSAIRCILAHGRDPMAGLNPLGPVSALEQDAIGARYEVPMLDTSWNRDLLPGLRAGLYSASFHFRVLREEIDSAPPRSAHNPDRLEERSLVEVQLREFGPCVFAAYPEATANARSLSARSTDSRSRATVELITSRRPWLLTG